MAIYHLTTNIAGLMRNCTDRRLGLMFNMNGKQVRKQLQEKLDNGEKLLPSDNCEHFDPVKGCLFRFHE